jgi:hypothetical protein
MESPAHHGAPLFGVKSLSGLLTDQAQPPGPPAETTTLERRKGNPVGCSVFGVADLYDRRPPNSSA